MLQMGQDSPSLKGIILIFDYHFFIEKLLEEKATIVELEEFQPCPLVML